MHKTTVCKCGKQLSTCRCASPNKTIVVSDKPCTHKVEQETLDAESMVWANYAVAFGMPVHLFKPIVEKMLEDLDKAKND